MKPLGLILPLILFLCLHIRARIKIISIVFVTIFSLFFASCSHFVHSEIQGVMFSIVDNQKSFAIDESGNNYRIYEDFVYSTDLAQEMDRITPYLLLRALPNGVAHFLFSPFPWRTMSKLRLYSYPQTISWYFIVLCSFFGALIGMRYRSQKILPIFIWVSFWVLLLSLLMGNEGTAARQRDLISPFFFIFASAGIINFFGRKVFDSLSNLTEDAK